MGEFCQAKSPSKNCHEDVKKVSLCDKKDTSHIKLFFHLNYSQKDYSHTYFNIFHPQHNVALCFMHIA